MPTAKDMLKKAKEYLNSPAVLKYQRNHIRFQIEYIGSDKQLFYAFFCSSEAFKHKRIRRASFKWVIYEKLFPL
jgi:hypothetical protein